MCETLKKWADMAMLERILSSVTDSLKEFERAHEEGVHHRELASARLLPWKTLGEQFSILEAELQERILRLSVEENFSPALAMARRRPGNILPGCLPMATASLDADKALAALRFRIVPGKLSEEEFWRCYFWCAQGGLDRACVPTRFDTPSRLLLVCCAQAGGQHQMRAPQRLCNGQPGTARGRAGRERGAGAGGARRGRERRSGTA